MWPKPKEIEIQVIKVHYDPRSLLSYGLDYKTEDNIERGCIYFCPELNHSFALDGSRLQTFSSNHNKVEKKKYKMFLIAKPHPNVYK